MTQLPDNVRAAQHRLSDMFRTLPKKLGYADLQSEVDWKTIRDYLVRVSAANELLVRWKGEIDQHRIARNLSFPDDYDSSPKYAVTTLLADAAREG